MYAMIKIVRGEHIGELMLVAGQRGEKVYGVLEHSGYFEVPISDTSLSVDVDTPQEAQEWLNQAYARAYNKGYNYTPASSQQAPGLTEENDPYQDMPNRAEWLSVSAGLVVGSIIALSGEQYIGLDWRVGLLVIIACVLLFVHTGNRSRKPHIVGKIVKSAAKGFHREGGRKRPSP